MEINEGLSFKISRAQKFYTEKMEEIFVGIVRNISVMFQQALYNVTYCPIYPLSITSEHLC